MANSKQLEVDYQEKNGTNIESHYKGTGGVQLSSIFTRAAFALRLGDFNLLISSQITDKSRIMFIRDPVTMAQTAAPFLTFDHNPYAVINSQAGPDHGHIDWIVDGYTTTSNYAYSQNADTQQVAVGSSLPGSYNYVRNSVKVVIDAYTGKMTFYDADPQDPILQAYSAAFPNMFVPISKMPASLQAHLRYPPDIFSIQSAIYGRYHLTNSGAFYAASNAWQLSPTAGAGPQSQALLAENTYNNQGQLVSTTPARMAPQYQVYSLPGTDPDKQVFTVSDGFVPAAQTNLSGSNQNFNLTAWMVGLADGKQYGQLNLYEVPQGTAGPANADAEISANKTRVVGHHAARPARLRGPAGGDADGPDRRLHGLSAAALLVADDEPAAAAAVRGGCAREERAESTRPFRASCPTSWARPCRCRRSQACPPAGRCPRQWRESWPRRRPTTPTRWPPSRPATWRSTRRTSIRCSRRSRRRKT